MSWIPSLYILALLWMGWCFLHSLLISRSFTARMKSIMGRRFASYRLAYNIFSLLTLVPVLIYQLLLEENIIFAWPWPWSLLKYSMYLGAFIFFYGGARTYDLSYVLGIKQINAMKGGRKRETMKFTTEGILNFVRHPWYSGAILIVWAFNSITDVSLISKIILTTYIIIGTFLEERKLIHAIGEPYLEYRKRVPMLFPWKRVEPKKF